MNFSHNTIHVVQIKPSKVEFPLISSDELLVFLLIKCESVSRKMPCIS